MSKNTRCVKDEPIHQFEPITCNFNIKDHEDVKWMNKHLKLQEKRTKTKHDVRRMNNDQTTINTNDENHKMKKDEIK